MIELTKIEKSEWYGSYEKEIAYYDECHAADAGWHGDDSLQ